MNYRNLIAEKLSEFWEFDQGDIENAITSPPDIELGDFALPCFMFAKKLKKAPKEIAEEAKKRLSSVGLPFKEIRAVSGYLNFFIDRSAEVSVVLASILNQSDTFGNSDEGKGKPVIVEFSSPNVAKPIALHHLRSTMIGNAICNLLTSVGFEVKRINYLGDWGTNFGKLLTSFEKWGNEKGIEETDLERQVYLYQRFEREKDTTLEARAREWFKRLEDGDPVAKERWGQFRELSIMEFEKIYRRLNVHFDSFEGESSVQGLIEEVVRKIDKKIGLKRSEGADIVEFEDEKLPALLIRKSDGATLYATRDIAEAIRRKRIYKFAKNLYVVATQQNLHFRSVFMVLEKLGYKWSGDCVHVAFGMMLFNDRKMATRSGNIVYLQDVLDKSRDLAREIIKEKNPELENREDVAEKVGVGAIVFNDLKNRRIKNVNFDWKEVLNFDGETGPYVQYTFARIGSIIRKSGNDVNTLAGKVFDFNPELLSSAQEISLVKQLSIFPDTVMEAARAYEPSIIAKYLIELVSTLNAFYNKHRVISDDPDRMKARLALIFCVRQVIKNSAGLLGLPLPEKM